MSTPLASADLYRSGVAERAAFYGEARFQDVHGSFCRFIPEQASLVLDVGAGTGRDAAALAALGHHVTAVEPSAAMREWAFENHRCGTVAWVDDHLPHLSKLRAGSDRYAFILCSAVLMHLPEAALRPAFDTFRTLLDPGGFAAVSVRKRRQGDHRKLFHEHSDHLVLAAASASGLTLVQADTTDDVLGRAEVKWRSFVFS